MVAQLLFVAVVNADDDGKRGRSTCVSRTVRFPFSWLVVRSFFPLRFLFFFLECIVCTTKFSQKDFTLRFFPTLHICFWCKKTFFLESKSEKMLGKRCCVASAKPPSPPPLPKGKEEIAAAAALASGRESLFSTCVFRFTGCLPQPAGRRERHSGFAAASSSSPSVPNPTTANPPPPLGLEGEWTCDERGRNSTGFSYKKSYFPFFYFFQKCYIEILL